MAKNTFQSWLKGYVDQYGEEVMKNSSEDKRAGVMMKHADIVIRADKKIRRDNLNEAEGIVERNTKRVRRTEKHSENKDLIAKEKVGLEVLEGLYSDIEQLSSFNTVIYNRVMQSNDRISIYQIPEKVRRGVAEIYLRDRLSDFELENPETNSETPFSPHEMQEISAADLLPELYADHAKRAVVNILTETNQKSAPIVKRQKKTKFANNIQIIIAKTYAENEEVKRWLEENWGLYIVETGAGKDKSYTLGTMAKGKNKKNPSPIGDGRNVVEIITKAIDENGLPTDKIGKSVLSVVLNQPIDPTDENSASVSTLFADKFMEVPEGTPQINVDPVKVANTINEMRRDFEFRESIYGDEINHQVGSQENIQESARNAMDVAMDNMSDIYADVLSQSILDTISGHDNTTARQLKRIFGKDGKILVRAIKEVLPGQDRSFKEGEFDLIMPDSDPIVKAIVEKLAETRKSQDEVQRIASTLGYKVTFNDKGEPIVEGEASPQLIDKIKSNFEKASEDEMKLYDKNKEIFYGAKFEEDSLRKEIAIEESAQGGLIRNHQWRLYSTVALKYVDPISQEILLLEGFINGNQTFQNELHGIKVKVAEWFKGDIREMLAIRQDFADEAEFVRFAAQQRIKELEVIRNNTITMIATGIEKAYEGIPGFDRATIDMMLGSEVEGLTLSSHEDILNFIATAGTPENTQYRLDMVNGIWDRIINDPNMSDEKREKLINTYEYKVGEGQPSFFVEISRDENGNFVTHYRTQEEQTRYNNVKMGVANAIENGDSSFLTENTFTEEGLNSVKRLGNGFINFRPVLQEDGTYIIEDVEVVPGLTEEKVNTWKNNNNIGPKYNIYNPNNTSTVNYTTSVPGDGGVKLEDGDEIVLTGDDAGKVIKPGTPKDSSSIIIDPSLGAGDTVGPVSHDTIDTSKGKIKILTREEAEKGELGVINLIGGPDPEHRYCLVLPAEMVANMNADLDTIAAYDAQYYVDLAEKGEDDAYAIYESHIDEINNKYNGSITNTSSYLENAYNASSDEIKADLQKSAMAGFDSIASQPILPENESEEGTRNKLINNRRANVLAIAKEVLGEEIYNTIVVTSLDETGASVTTINSEVLAAKLEEKGKTDEFTLRFLSAVGKSEIERHRSAKCSEKLTELKSSKGDPVILSTTGGEDKNPTTAWKYTPVSVAGGYASKDSRRKAIDNAYKWYLTMSKKWSAHFDELERKQIAKMRNTITSSTYPAYAEPIFKDINKFDRRSLEKYSTIFDLLGGEDGLTEAEFNAIISDPENIRDFDDPEVCNFIIKYHINGPEFYEKLIEKGVIEPYEAAKAAFAKKKEINEKIAAIQLKKEDGTPKTQAEIEEERKQVYMEVYGQAKELSFDEMLAIEEAKLAGPAVVEPVVEPVEPVVEPVVKSDSEEPQIEDYIYAAYEDKYHELLPDDEAIDISDDIRWDKSTMDVVILGVNTSDNVEQLNNFLKEKGIEVDDKTLVDILCHSEVMNVIATCSSGGAKFYLDNSEKLGLTDSAGEPLPGKDNTVHALNVQKVINQEMFKIEKDNADKSEEEIKAMQEAKVQEMLGSKDPDNKIKTVKDIASNIDKIPEATRESAGVPASPVSGGDGK